MNNEFALRLACIHEIGHALMMYLLSPDVNVIDKIVVFSYKYPCIYALEILYDVFDDEEKRRRAITLIVISGGIMELIILRHYQKVFLESYMEEISRNIKEIKAGIFACMGYDINYYFEQFDSEKEALDDFGIYSSEAESMIQEYLSGEKNIDNIVFLFEQLRNDGCLPGEFIFRTFQGL